MPPIIILYHRNGATIKPNRRNFSFYLCNDTTTSDDDNDDNAEESNKEIMNECSGKEIENFKNEREKGK